MIKRINKKNKMKIKKGDTVKMLYGKDAGRQGPVVAVNTKKRQVVVEGLNIYKKHIKGDGRTRVSEIIEVTKPVPVSKVMLICPFCNKPTRVGYKIEGDKKVRICKKCGKTVDVEQKEEDKKEEKKGEKKTKSKKSRK
jgi:large subunit ribosomal protein L24